MSLSGTGDPNGRSLSTLAGRLAEAIGLTLAKNLRFPLRISSSDCASTDRSGNGSTEGKDEPYTILCRGIDRLLISQAKSRAFGDTIGPYGLTASIINTTGKPATDITVILTQPLFFTTKPGAPIDDFQADTDFADMGLGTPVGLLIPSAGTLPTGTTDVATFVPSLSGYEAELVSIEGGVVGLAEVITVPEPSTLALVLAGANLASAIGR